MKLLKAFAKTLAQESEKDRIEMKACALIGALTGLGLLMVGCYKAEMTIIKGSILLILCECALALTLDNGGNK